MHLSSIAIVIFFCVLNPDIIFLADPFPRLVSALLHNPTIGVIGPFLVDSNRQLQDSARSFPTPGRLFYRLLKRQDIILNNSEKIFYPDWIAGMFMLFPSRIFSSVHGFDERFFMYYEDVDICRRLGSISLKTACFADILAVHNARRSSRRNLIHFYWHVKSMLRFFLLDQ